MGGTNIFTKDPQAKWNYSISWSLLLPTGETITTSTWAVPTGITEVSDSKTGTTTTIVLSGGTLGESYSLVNHIVTTPGGYEDDRTIVIQVRAK